MATREDNWTIYQYYIRYLACSGRLNDLFYTLIDIQNNYFDEEEFINFINDSGMQEFNYEPFIFTFIRWNTDVRSFRRLVEMGCRLGMETEDGWVGIDEGWIHGEHWTNPFAGIMDIPGFPDEFTIAAIQEAFNIPTPRDEQFYHNNRDRPVVRHELHFENIINAIQHAIQHDIEQ